MMILPFSARLRGTLLTLTLTLLSGCALIQDEPSQVAIVNPQQAQLAQVIHWRTATGRQPAGGRPMMILSSIC